jgi:hypothetical protein
MTVLSTMGISIVNLSSLRIFGQCCRNATLYAAKVTLYVNHGETLSFQDADYTRRLPLPDFTQE